MHFALNFLQYLFPVVSGKTFNHSAPRSQCGEMWRTKPRQIILIGCQKQLTYFKYMYTLYRECLHSFNSVLTDVYFLNFTTFKLYKFQSVLYLLTKTMSKNHPQRTFYGWKLFKNLKLNKSQICWQRLWQNIIDTVET